jgi:hypothetical protein
MSRASPGMPVSDRDAPTMPVAPGAQAVHAAWLLPAMALLAAVLWTIAAIVPLDSAARFLPFTLVCAAPGVLLVRRLYRHATRSWLFAVLVGPVWGYALTSLVLLGLWTAGVRKPVWFLLAAGLTSVACSLARPLDGLRVPTLGRRDAAAVCLALLLVPIVVGRPYACVGERSPEGEAWRAYFTADFVWGMAVVSEVSKGDVPPRNPYRLDSQLHYYWLAHLVPSLEHRVTQGETPLKQLLLANAVLAGLAFVGFLYVFIRHFVDSPTAAALACAAAILFHSLEGLEELIALWRLGAPLDLVQYLNIDAVTRWVYHSMPVDGLQRLLLYQPQHQLGYVMGCSALLVLVQARDAARIGVMALAGSLIALSLLLSTFSALMIATVAAVFQGVRMLRAGHFTWMIPCAAAAAVPIGAAIVLTEYFGYVEHGGRLVSLVVNQMAWHHAPLAIGLSFGGLLIGAAAGGMFAWARRDGRFALLGTLIGVCWFYYFFVDVRDHQHVYVGWRAGHLLFIAFAPLVGFAIQECWRARGRTRVMALVTAVVLVLAAAPTTAIDLYNTQDTSNRGETPSGRWTLIIPSDELEALAWIREQTPAAAVVQVDPEVRDPATWAYIPAFAERRMAAGLPISMIPLRKYQEATTRVLNVYRARTADSAYVKGLDAGIDYLVIAPLERTRYPDLEARLDGSPHLWPLAFRNNSVSIYAVAKAH